MEMEREKEKKKKTKNRASDGSEKFGVCLKCYGNAAGNYNSC